MLNRIINILGFGTGAFALFVVFGILVAQDKTKIESQKPNISKQPTVTSNFQVKVESFLKMFSDDFSPSKENLIGTGQGYDFENKTNPIWTKRITLKSKTSFVNNYQQTVYQRLYFSFFQYENSKRTLTALDSLLNCFGGACTKLKWDAKSQSAKTIPCIYLINEKEIVACYINCEHQNDFWMKLKDEIEKTFSNGTSRVMETGCGGPINFKTI